MTIPGEYRATSKTIGDDRIPHPVYTFSINLARTMTEQFGPAANRRTVSVLHPDQHDTSADRGRAATSVRDAQRLSFLPGLLAGENVVMNDDGTITAYGQKAVYIKKRYADIAEPFLVLTNSAPYRSGSNEYNQIGSGGVRGGGAAVEQFTDNP